MSINPVRFGSLTFRPTTAVLEDDNNPKVFIWAGDHFEQKDPASMQILAFNRRLKEMATHCNELDTPETFNSKKTMVQEFILNELKQQKSLHEPVGQDSDREILSTIDSLTVALTPLELGMSVFKLDKPKTTFLIAPSNLMRFVPPEN